MPVFPIQVLFFAMLLLPLQALASDGVREINATCAQQTGCFPGDLAGYPVTITAGGSYVLTSSLDVPATIGIRGVEISDGPVTLDLNGFAIVGPGSCTSLPPICSGNLATTGIEVTSQLPVRILNGSLTGLFTAIYTPTGSGVYSLRLENLDIEENGGTAIFFNGSGSSTVRNCRINRNGIDGIDIAIAHPVVISESTFRSNGNHAIFSAGSASMIENSFFSSNGGNGIRSFFLGIPFTALTYRGNSFYSNSTDVFGGTQLGPNFCTTALCP